MKMVIAKPDVYSMRFNWNVFRPLAVFFTVLFLFPAAHAGRSECRGYGGVKICSEPDINPVQGPYIADMNYYNSCQKIGVAGGVANNRYQTYEIVSETGTIPSQALFSPTIPPGYDSNNCTNLPSNLRGYFPASFSNSIGCSYGSQDNGDPVLCIPAAGGEKNIGKQCANVECGNPINYAFGNKFQQEMDYVGASGLSFIRYYNSYSLVNQNASKPREIGVNWRHSFKYVVGMSTVTPTVAKAYRPDGRAYSFYNPTPETAGSKWAADGDVNDSLVKIVDAAGLLTGWEYRRADDDSLEKYGADGQVQSIKYRNGTTLTFTYSGAATSSSVAPAAGLLIQVDDDFGHSIKFNYDIQRRIVQMRIPTGESFLYNYDEASSIRGGSSPKSNNLTSVIFPDGKKRTYWYNEQNKTANTNIPSALTGITDENMVRFATFTYNASRKPVSTEHAGGVEKYTVNYEIPEERVIVTDPLGAQRRHTIKSILQVLKSSAQPSLSANGSGDAAIAYDLKGNAILQTDFNGNRTAYTYGERNLESTRTDAYGTSFARTTTTEWHTTFRLPVAVAEPGRITKYTYDANGNVLQITLQATADPSGASGLAAVLTGSPRTWSKTYSSLGQLLTSTGPTNDVTTNSYDSQGNLLSITNSAGHVTAFSNYDANGKAGRITDPNGLVTDLTYTPRGWLASKTAGGEVWRFDYDGVGQLILLTSPDNSVVAYTYDGAHRLIAVADSAGNSIMYTLDAMGNRLSEAVKDPGGNLARQTTRVYDAMNRLKQQTGGAQ